MLNFPSSTAYSQYVQIVLYVFKSEVYKVTVPFASHKCLYKCRNQFLLILFIAQFIHQPKAF